MTALDWVRKNATQFDRYELEVEGEKYIATWFSFKGRVPNRMVFQLRDERSALIENEGEREVLRVGGQYRSEFNNVVYTRTLYEKVA